MDSTAPVSIKLYYKDDVRRTRIAANATYEELAAAVEQAFGIAGDLAWKDEDGDQVNVKTDADWAEAMNANPKLVKLFFTPKQQPLSMTSLVEIEEQDNVPTTPDHQKMPDDSDFILAEVDSMDKTDNTAQDQSTDAVVAEDSSSIANAGDSNSSLDDNSSDNKDTQSEYHEEQQQQQQGQQQNGNGASMHNGDEPGSDDNTLKPEIPKVPHAKCASHCKAARGCQVVSSSEARETILKKSAVHHGIECDASGQNPIVGTRYHLIHYNYDVNEAEFNKLSSEQQALFEVIAYPGAEPKPVSTTTVPIINDMIKSHRAARTERRHQQREKESKETQHPHYAYIPAGDVIPPFRAAFGSVGPGITQLQHALIAIGAMSPDVISRRAGFFGPGTTKAVRDYKVKEGIESAPYQHGTYDEAVYDSLIEKIDDLVNGSGESGDGSNDSSPKQQQQQNPEKEQDEDTTTAEDGNGYVVVDAVKSKNTDPTGKTLLQNTSSASSTSADATAKNDDGTYTDAGIVEGEQWEAELKGLVDMGFVDTKENRRLLNLHHGSLPFVIASLV